MRRGDGPGRWSIMVIPVEAMQEGCGMAISTNLAFQFHFLLILYHEISTHPTSPAPAPGSYPNLLCKAHTTSPGASCLCVAQQLAMSRNGTVRGASRDAGFRNSLAVLYQNKRQHHPAGIDPTGSAAIPDWVGLEEEAEMAITLEASLVLALRNAGG